MRGRGRGPGRTGCARRRSGPRCGNWARNGIGHGIGAAADPALMAHLAGRGIALEVFPTSNVCTGAAPSLAEHPLPVLLAAGFPVTLATDDPGMFHTTLNDEYLLCHEQFGLGPGDLAEIARAGRGRRSARNRSGPASSPRSAATPRPGDERPDRSGDARRGVAQPRAA